MLLHFGLAEKRKLINFETNFVKIKIVMGQKCHGTQRKREHALT